MSFKISSTVNDGYPYHDITNSLVEVFSEDPPVGLFTQGEDGYPVYGSVSSGLVAVPQSPLPSGMLVQSSGGYPMYADGDTVPVGMCLGCSSLTSVTIPRSVKRISDYSFWETALRSVKISSDCVYYEHSFPTGCVISHYEE